jgi:CBS domain-containing protein
MTHVSEVMTHGVRTLSPQDTMQRAARTMSDLNIGALPVCDGEKLVGMVTDRDITVRGVAQGCPPDSTTLRELMSPEVRWCFDDAPLDEALEQMRDAQIRRLPVIDHERHLVGMLSLGDVATTAGTADVAETLACISEPAQPDH